LIDKSNFGTSNDGNTARRIFGNPEVSASNPEVLQTLASGHYILIEMFPLGTAEEFIAEIPLISNAHNNS